MTLRVRWIALLACLTLNACINEQTGDTANPDGNVAGTTDTGGNNDTVDSTGGTDGTTDGSALLTGTIDGSAARRSPRAQAASRDGGYMIVAQSNETGGVFRTLTDNAGAFALEVPADEDGNTFIVTIVGPDGRTEGPVMFGGGGGAGKIGLELSDETSLGTIELPADSKIAPIEPGSDATVKDSSISDDVTTRLNDFGAPLGLETVGKGEDTRLGDAPGEGADADQDGLIGIFDADDDGDGIVDDFDGAGDVGGEASADIRPNFFMNLKIGVDRAATYYNGTTDEIAAALATDTIITFEVVAEPGAKRQVTAAAMLATPAPDYFNGVEQLGAGSGGGQIFTPWADGGFAFEEKSDRFDAFVRPNAVMDAGDSFTVEVVFDDGTTEQHSRMINYVFMNIPRLRQSGADGALQAYDISDPSANGSPGGPLTFNGAKDLVLEFNPPPDETGAFLTDLDYGFSIFYLDANGAQIQGVDGPATYPTPPAGFSTSNTTLNVAKTELVLSVDDTYTVTLPAELFVDTVQSASGPQAVGGYQIDITALAPSGNCALILRVEKQ